MSTEIPEPIRSIDIARWSGDYDVVVVGFGMGGGCAAVEAAAAGARVLVLERAAVPGGTTVMAGGHFYLGGGTKVQIATGHDDSPTEMAKYLTAVSREPEHAKIAAYSEGSVEHCDWLEALGFEFERSFYPEKAVIQPGTQGLMFTGNEKVWPFKDLAKPAPRGHKVPVPGDTQGAKMVIELLVQRAVELGVEVQYETGASALIIDDEGAVVGVRWRRFEETGTIRAGAVIIAAGGFVMNPEMVAEHVPQLAEKPFVLGSTYDDGLGIRLGISVGAQTKHMDQAFITAPIYPPSQLITGVVVNGAGQRFVAEDSYHSRTSAFALEQPGAVAFLIVDSEHMNRPDFPLVPFIDGWETIAEMEADLGIPASNLQATLDRYNANAARHVDPDFHKAAEWLAPQNVGPWAAFDLRLGKALYAGFTMGGLSTNIDGQVRRPDGSTIRGLYAAGACAANLAQDGKGYASGTQLGEASFSADKQVDTLRVTVTPDRRPIQTPDARGGTQRAPRHDAAMTRQPAPETGRFQSACPSVVRYGAHAVVIGLCVAVDLSLKIGFAATECSLRSASQTLRLRGSIEPNVYWTSVWTLVQYGRNFTQSCKGGYPCVLTARVPVVSAGPGSLCTARAFRDAGEKDKIVLIGDERCRRA